MWGYWCGALFGGVAIASVVVWRRRAGRAPLFVALTDKRIAELIDLQRRQDRGQRN